MAKRGYTYCPTPARTSPFEQQKMTERDERFMAIPFVFTMSGSEYSTTLRISISYDFRMEMMNSYYERDYYLQIRDDFRTEELFYEPVRGSLITGDGRLPFILSKPYTFAAGTSITVTVIDTQTGSPHPAIVEVVLIGYRVLR